MGKGCALLSGAYMSVAGLAGLRSPECQAVLGKIAATPDIHVVASIDHVNAPLLWDKCAAARFNWLYQELTTFMPYNVETLSLQPLLCDARFDPLWEEIVLMYAARS